MMLHQLASEFVRGLPSDLLAAIEESAREEVFPPGASLFAEGSNHADFHIVLEGHVRLEMTAPRRGRISLLTLGPGDMLAWSALLSDGTMTAAAVALDCVRTASLPGEKLRRLCEEQPIFGYHLMKQLAVALSRRLLATRLQLMDLVAEHEPAAAVPSEAGRYIDPEC
jgi:CRP/FNR family transcriptional regulator, cyclic AMP receptor protein